ncbi:hypothetical protein [Campylobacter gastrosuis]|uniref:Uncharacterized protein n=1 Tax=Campylobacter gastrosuis TaxID=2974576 RepID=A0ABT7HNV5_9BACT|nr:hypothetical protein [Campylobacter gastrosuis]MDL0088589.1 hypothetical protein [Campylobacter gastrosuis]
MILHEKLKLKLKIFSFNERFVLEIYLNLYQVLSVKIYNRQNKIKNLTT